MRKSLGGSQVARLGYGCIVAGRLGIERWVLGWRGSAVGNPTTHGRILAYHSIGTPQWGVNDVRPRDFERHLQIAADDGWGFGTPGEVMAEPEKKLLALTFDDGISSVLANAAPVLRHHGIPATSFVVTGWADGQHPDGYQHVLDWRGLAKLQDSGIRLASHSVNHPDFGRLDAGEAARELEVSRQQLHDMLDIDVDEFAIPFGQSRNWTESASLAASDAGYTTLYAQAVDSRPAGTVPRTFITRIDRPRLFRAALAGCFDRWEEWH